MRILLIHPLDTADRGTWASHPWDLIVDLGRDGTSTYDTWRKRFHCGVENLHALRDGFEDFYRIRELLGKGCGHLVDEHGLDWWEILSILMHEEVEALFLLQRLAPRFRAGDEVYVTRAGMHADFLQCLSGTTIKSFRPFLGLHKGPGHYLHVLAKLSGSQIVDVLGDKYDPGYQLRGRWTGRRAASTREVVLIPTAYVNVSRTGVAYAKTFPEENFLLVTTRRSGWVHNPPQNVQATWLAAYASVRDRRSENADMNRRLHVLLREFCPIPEIEILNRLGHFESFPRRLRHGLEIRDAWRSVLDSEPVKGVLCADDSNPYTRIPLLLARERGLVNIACHHGALDARYVFKHSYGSVIWAKGKMEQDYLVRRCKVPAGRVEICAPALEGIVTARERPNDRESRPYVLFISEMYEVNGGRGEGFYRDILLPLVAMVRAEGRQLMVKLHPAESKRERTQMLTRLLSAERRKAVQVVSGPLTEALLEKTWCGVTILSTVATECAIRGIPCFLCTWLESHPYEYVQQYLRFGAGVGLNGPSDIARIPEYLRRGVDSQGVADNVYQPAEPGRLRELLSSDGKEFAPQDVRNRKQKPGYASAEPSSSTAAGHSQPYS
jgi:hypothetical protein